MTKHDNDTQCCAKFDPEPWQEKEIRNRVADPVTI